MSRPCIKWRADDPNIQGGLSISQALNEQRTGFQKNSTLFDDHSVNYMASMIKKR